MRLNPLDYWTVFIFRKLWPYMTLDSIWRYRSVQGRLRVGKPRLDSRLLLRMKAPARHTIYLREGLADLDSFDDIFVRDAYRIVADGLTDCRTIIDLGGNIGLATLYFAIRFPDTRIMSVEPHPQNFELLLRNLAPFISSKRCSALQAAVWGSEKILVADPAMPSDRYNAFAVCDSPTEDGTSFRVRGLTMNAIMGQSGFEEVDLLKIDIEGAERELFRGDLSWLGKTRAVAIEFHGDSRRDSDFDTIIQNHGFRIAGKNDHTLLATK